MVNQSRVHNNVYGNDLRIKRGISAQNASDGSKAGKQDAGIEINKLPEPVKELIIAEYTNLTTKLNNRQSIRYQMIQFVLAAMATLLTVGSVSTKELAPLISGYPVFVLALSIIYTANAFEMRRMQSYIKMRIEIFLPEKIGWYGYRHSGKIEHLDIMGNMGSKAVFIVTAIAALLVGQHRDTIVLDIGVGAAIVLTILLLGEGLLYEEACKRGWIEQPIESEEIVVSNVEDPQI